MHCDVCGRPVSLLLGDLADDAVHVVCVACLGDGAEFARRWAADLHAGGGEHEIAEVLGVDEVLAAAR